MKINRTRQRLKHGETCIGTMIREVRSPQVIQLMAASGWDFLIADAEHGLFDMETLADLASVARYVDATLMIRVPDNIYHLIARPLDLGVEGILCPRVDSREEAEQVVKAVKYAPLGDRGVSVSGIATEYRPTATAEYLGYANENMLIAIQIESVQALGRLDEILSVTGIDAVFIGPEDLSQSMGIAGQIRHPLMWDAYQRVIEACNRHNVAPGMHFGDLPMMKEWMARGMRFVAYKTDFRLLQEVSQMVLKALKG